MHYLLCFHNIWMLPGLIKNLVVLDNLMNMVLMSNSQSMNFLVLVLIVRWSRHTANGHHDLLVYPVKSDVFLIGSTFCWTIRDPPRRLYGPKVGEMEAILRLPTSRELQRSVVVLPMAHLLPRACHLLLHQLAWKTATHR